MALDEAQYAAIQDKHATADTAALIRSLFKVKAQRADLEKKVDALKTEAKIVEKGIKERMEADGLSETAIKGVGKVFLQEKVFFSVKVENRDAVYARFKKSKNFRGLVKETVNAQSLNAAMKEYFEKENKIPEGVDHYTDTVIATRKQK